MKIVICDKDEVYLRKLKHLLEEIYCEKRYEVDIYTFSDSRTFLSYAEKEKADVVILYLIIDEMDGIDVGRQLRLLQGNKVKLIYISSINAYATETYEPETAAFLLKPINKSKLKKICNILPYNEQL